MPAPHSQQHSDDALAAAKAAAMSLALRRRKHLFKTQTHTQVVVDSPHRTRRFVANSAARTCYTPCDRGRTLRFTPFCFHPNPGVRTARTPTRASPRPLRPARSTAQKSTSPHHPIARVVSSFMRSLAHAICMLAIACAGTDACTLSAHLYNRTHRDGQRARGFLKIRHFFEIAIDPNKQCVHASSRCVCTRLRLTRRRRRRR